MSKNGKKTERNEDGTFKEGNSGGGRPPGQRNYTTIYREALKKIAEAEGKTAEEMEEMIEEVGLKEALEGNYSFFKDIRDRVHGKAQEKVDVTTDGKELPAPIIRLDEIRGNNKSSEDSESQ